MHRYRFFLTRPFAGGTVPLEANDVHHLRDVLRLGPGSVIDAVAPDGEVHRLRLDRVGTSSVEATVVGTEGLRSRVPLVVCQGVSKGRKMELVVQKVTELGAAKLVPFTCERSVVRLDAAKAKERQERWQRVAREASKQSGRTDIMHVDVPVSLLGLRPVLTGCSASFVLWEKAGLPLREALSRLDGGSVVLVVGPEGGLAAEEVEELQRWGATPASLGPLTLRTETAAIAATSIIGYELGWIGGTV